MRTTCTSHPGECSVLCTITSFLTFFLYNKMWILYIQLCMHALSILSFYCHIAWTDLRDFKSNILSSIILYALIWQLKLILMLHNQQYIHDFLNNNNYALKSSIKITNLISYSYNQNFMYVIVDRLHVLELMVAFYLFFCGWYDFYFGKNSFYIYLFLQGMAFFIAGIGYVGVSVPSS